MTRVLTVLVALSGAALTIGGIAMWSIPAAIVTAGVGLLAAGLLLDWDKVG